MNLQAEPLLPALAALGIGLLIGLEREYHQRQKRNTPPRVEAAGIRTFALTALLGHMLTWMPGDLRNAALLLGFIGVTGLAFIGYRRSSKGKKADIGITT
ncbi:MAG: MgtC/SapB family protein, partial [Mariprofundaceae bacterium]